MSPYSMLIVCEWKLFERCADGWQGALHNHKMHHNRIHRTSEYDVNLQSVLLARSSDNQSSARLQIRN